MDTLLLDANLKSFTLAFDIISIRFRGLYEYEIYTITRYRKRTSKGHGCPEPFLTAKLEVPPYLRLHLFYNPCNQCDFNRTLRYVKNNKY